jgi:hypothetical protein
MSGNAKDQFLPSLRSFIHDTKEPVDQGWNMI